MTETADVVIVGAGIMGVSTAYHLARLGVGRVIVLERDTVCSGSTALASGGIRHQYANRLGIELTTHSIVTYERFREEFGVDPHFRQHGYLILIATEDELATARRSVALQRSLGVDVTLLDAAATRALCPYLNTDDLLGATYTPRDGYADPYLCTTAIAARARDLGVAITTAGASTAPTAVVTPRTRSPSRMNPSTSCPCRISTPSSRLRRASAGMYSSGSL